MHNVHGPLGAIYCCDTPRSPMSATDLCAEAASRPEKDGKAVVETIDLQCQQSGACAAPSGCEGSAAVGGYSGLQCQPSYALGLPVVDLDGSGNPFVVSGVGKHQGLTTSQQLGIIVTLVSSLVRGGVLALSMDQLDKLVVATSLSREVIMAAGCVVCLALLMVLKLLLDRVFGGSSSSTELSNVPLPTVGKGGKRVTVEEK